MNANWCQVHPHYLAEIIVDCGQYHRICVECMKRMAKNSQGHCCPICQGPIKDGELLASPIAEEKLQASIGKLEKDNNGVGELKIW